MNNVDKNNLVLWIAESICDIYSSGLFHAPYTFMVKAMVEAGIVRGISMHALGIKDQEATPEYQLPSSTVPIYTEVWNRDFNFSGWVRLYDCMIKFNIPQGILDTWYPENGIEQIKPFFEVEDIHSPPE